MQKVRLLNTSEHLTEQTLRRVLDDTRFRVYAQLPLGKVIRPELNETVTKADKNSLQNSELDFVIYDEESQPQFAIEFNGPSHQLYESKKRSDLRKSRLCHKARLSLLRITDVHLEEHDKTTLLEYIIRRFVSWDNEHDKINAEIEDEMSRLSDEEIEHLTEGGIADPSIDPTFRFDIRHPFPGTKEIAKRLLNNYGIISPHVSFKLWMEASQREKVLELFPKGMQKGAHGYDFVVSTEYELTEKTRDGNRTATNALQVFHSRFAIQWCLPLADDYDWEREAPISYFKRTGNSPIAYQEIPGVSMPELVENMCEFLALRQAETWVMANLPHHTGLG